MAEKRDKEATDNNLKIKFANTSHIAIIEPQEETRIILDSGITREEVFYNTRISTKLDALKRFQWVKFSFGDESLVIQDDSITLNFHTCTNMSLKVVEEILHENKNLLDLGMLPMIVEVTFSDDVEFEGKNSKIKYQRVLSIYLARAPHDQASKKQQDFRKFIMDQMPEREMEAENTFFELQPDASELSPFHNVIQHARNLEGGFTKVDLENFSRLCKHIAATFKDTKFSVSEASDSRLIFIVESPQIYVIRLGFWIPLLALKRNFKARWDLNVLVINPEVGVNSQLMKLEISFIRLHHHPHLGEQSTSHLHSGEPGNSKRMRSSDEEESVESGNVLGGEKRLKTQTADGQEKTVLRSFSFLNGP